MPRFEPRDPDYEAKVRASFSRQTAMQTVGANHPTDQNGLGQSL